MRYAIALVSALSLFLPGASAPAQTVSAELTDAYFAWDRGEYEVALRGYLAALNGRSGDRLKDEIARLTGEPFEVTELTSDGGGIGVGPTGRYATYALGGLPEPTIAIVDLAETSGVVDTFPGASPTISPDGKVAFLRIERTPELSAAMEALNDAGARGDRTAIFEARDEIRWIEALNTRLWIRDIRAGTELEVALDGLVPVGMTYSMNGRTLFLAGGRLGDDRSSGIYAVRSSRLQPEAVLAGRGFKSSPMALPGGRYLFYLRPERNPLPQAPGTGPRGRGGRATEFSLADLRDGDILNFSGSEPTFSASGETLAFITRGSSDWVIEVVAVDPLGMTPGAAMRSARVVVRSSAPLASPALSSDGRLVTYQKRAHEDWDIYVAPTDGSMDERQVSNEIQHDLFPRFLDQDRILAVKGEGRHRRSFVYDLRDGSVTKLFHNNTVRTIAPEYEWAVSGDGSKVVIVSERDGDTVSPERGVYVVDLNRPVSKAAVRARLEDNLAAERRLTAKGERMFAPVRETIRAVTEQVSVDRIYRYEADLYAFGSKYITEPGNARAIDYLTRTLEGFGYAPELQWFEPRPGVRTANVVVRLGGSTDPELVCTVSSHFDSVRRGAGADDNTSGTAALLEAARVLAGKPLSISVELAFFTGEEAGLLGSREYVRRAVESDKHIVCALNNDMVGWANDQRLDNTIRYSNPGIRDVQHSAAAFFSELITYDALYYKNTDAHAYYEVYGDIVGGIGSYPVLGNPNYHQATDRLATINHRLVAEVSRTTVATVMLLASSPSRLSGLEARRSRVGVQITWGAAVESDVSDYRIRHTTSDGRQVETKLTTLPGQVPRLLLNDVLPGSRIGVKALNRRGLEGWDWAWVTVPF